MPTVSDLLQWTLAATGLIVSVGKLMSLWGKSKRDAMDSHESRFDKSWKRQEEMLDDEQSENARLRIEIDRLKAEIRDHWNRPDHNRRRGSRSPQGE